MSVASRFTNVLKSSKEINIDDSSKIIFFSDCHRGDDSWSDIFTKNQNMYSVALTHYFKQGYTYIEIGDGDELWANKDLSEIKNAHKDIFKVIKKFFDEKRLYMIWGNHDIVKKNKRFVINNLYYFSDPDRRLSTPLFENIECYEGLILKYKNDKNKIFIIHGHQGDLLNDDLWKFTRFLVRFFWRRLENIGFNDVTSPAKNYAKRDAINEKILKWVVDNNQVLIAGHTHKPLFPDEFAPQYFNDGCCVHPNGITGIEIHNGNIELIEWNVKTREDGSLYVAKEVIAGPRKLSSLFKISSNLSANSFITKY